MGFRRALTLAILAMWGLGAQAMPARADRDVVPSDDYSPYAPSGFFVLDWSGFYAGGHLGGAHTNAEATEIVPDPRDPTLTLLFNYDQSETSFTGGVQVGWQKQWGNLVVGAEAGFSLLHFDTSEISPLLADLGQPDLIRSVEVRDIFTLTGRLGYTDGRWLAYVKGGLANAEVDVGYTDTLTGATTSSSGRETGWIAGIGIDYALTHNLVLGVEYNYLDIQAEVPEPPVPGGDSDDLHAEIQSLVVRLNYRFGPGCCSRPVGY
jgi:outer membrane immunogenic protein